MGPLLAGRIERGLRTLLCVYVTLLPLALGGRESWALAGAVGFLIVAWSLWLLAAGLRGTLRIRTHWLFLLPCLIIAWASAQLLPGEFWRSLAPGSVLRWEELGTVLGISLSPRACLAPSSSRDALPVLVLVTAFAALAYQLFASRSGILQLAVAIVAAGALNAAVGYAVLFGIIPAPYEALRGATGCMAGTFWNRNHFGQLMMFGGIEAVGVVLAAWFTHVRWRQSASGSRRFVQRHWRGMALTLVTVSLLLFGAGLLSLSRGAFVGAVAGLLLLLALASVRRRARRRLLLAVLGFSLLALMGGQGVLARVGNRFDELWGTRSLTLNGRMCIWRESLGLLREHWLTGIGPEAFRGASQRYEGAWKLNMISLHAHNDWLELLIEYGIPIGGSVLLVMLIWLGVALRRCWRQSDPIVCWVGMGTGCALLGVAVHSFVDYPLRSPGMLTVAVGAIVVLALASRFREHRVVYRRLPLSLAMRAVCVAASMIIAGISIETVSPFFTAGRTRARMRDFKAARSASLTESSVVPVNRAAMALADRVLAAWPENVSALKERGAARNSLALAGWRALADPDSDRKTTMADVDALLEGAVGDFQRACLGDPCDGRAQLLLAHSLEHLGLFRRNPDEVRLKALYALVAASSPTFAENVYAAAEGLWRSCLREGRIDTQDRERALALFAMSIELDPSAADEVLTHLGQVDVSVAQLRLLLPEQLAAHEALYIELERRMLYSDCLAELETLEALNEARRDQPAPGLFSVDPVDDDLLLFQDVEDTISGRRVRLLGLLGRWSEREARARDDALQGREKDRCRLARAERLLEKGSPAIARALSEQVCREAPDFGEAHVQACRALRQLGRTDDALAALLPLVYRTGTDFPLSVYATAWSELEALDRLCLPREKGSILAAFLNASLESRLSLGTGNRVRDSLVEDLQEVARRARSEAGSHGWSQAHLASFYLGRACAASGRPEEAADAYAAVLEECPGHLPAVRELLALQPDVLGRAPIQSSDRDLAARIDDLIPLRGPLTPWLQLLGFKLRARSPSLSDGAELSLAVLCTDQPVGSGKLTVRFTQEVDRGFSVPIDIAEGNGDIPTWRVGQAFVASVNLNLHQLAAQARAPFQPGPCALAVSYECPGRRNRIDQLPAIVGLAFRVDAERQLSLFAHD